MSSQHLQPPPATSHSRRTPSPAASSRTPSPSRAPTSAHPTTTIADTALLQGTFPITIDAETIVHPRARIYSFDGPVRIGRGCMVGEKCVIGPPPDANGTGVGAGAGAGAGEGSTTTDTSEEKGITIADSVTISPLSTIHPGSTVEEAAVIDTLATIGRRARIGAHTKVCAGCAVPEGASVGDWMVVWGPADKLGRRKRRVPTAPAGLDGRIVEESRLMVLSKEREALSRLLVPTGASRKR